MVYPVLMDLAKNLLVLNRLLQIIKNELIALIIIHIRHLLVVTQVSLRLHPMEVTPITVQRTPKLGSQWPNVLKSNNSQKE